MNTLQMAKEIDQNGSSAPGSQLSASSATSYRKRRSCWDHRHRKTKSITPNWFVTQYIPLSNSIDEDPNENKEVTIPDSLKESAFTAQTHLIEQLAEEDSSFGDLYLEGDERMRDPSQLQQAIRRVLLRRIHPLF